MPDYTSHYNLIKPKKGENYDVEDTTCTNADIIDTELFKRQEKIPGKGLSTNDFTNQYKQKLDSLQNYDDSQVKQDISNIKSEQTTQNTNISANTTKNAEQDSLIQKLKDNMINLQTEEATSLYVTDAGTPPASLKVRGNHKQDGTPTLENPIEIETVKNEVNVVVSNKNMFNVPSSNLYGVEITLQEDGGYLINGTSTASWAFRVGEPVWLGAGDYVLSMEASSPLYQGGVGIQGSNNFKYELWDTSNKSIHLTEDKKVQCYFAFNINATYDNVVVKIQLEKSNTKTDWVKHEEIKKTLDIQQEMLKGDYFDLENDKEVCGFKKKIFTGTETISATVNGNSFSYIASDILADTNTIKIPKIYSNCYSACSWQDRNTNNKPNTVSAYNITIGFDKGNFATVEEFKAELAKRYSEGNPVYVIYPLAENEELDLTETQKQQLAQLDNLDLYRGINNIYTEEGIALMQLDYTADTKMYIDNLVTQNTAESEG